METAGESPEVGFRRCELKASASLSRSLVPQFPYPSAEGNGSPTRLKQTWGQTGEVMDVEAIER